MLTRKYRKWIKCLHGWKAEATPCGDAHVWHPATSKWGTLRDDNIDPEILQDLIAYVRSEGLYADWNPKDTEW